MNNKHIPSFDEFVNESAKFKGREVLPDWIDPRRDFGAPVKNVKDPPGRKTTDWLLAQTQGLFIVIINLHCVGVDCQNRRILDCLQETSSYLNKINLNIETPYIEDIREIVKI
jgi:hypothetical protein